MAAVMQVFRRVVAVGVGLTLAACAATPETPTAPPRAAEQFSVAGSYLAGRFAQSERDTAQAAGFFGRALAFDPNNPELLRRAFILTAAEGRIDEAAAFAERLRALGVGVQSAGLVRAVHAAKLGQWSRAEAELVGLPDSGYNGFLVPLLRAWVRAAQGDARGAVALLAPGGEPRGLEMFQDFHAALILDAAGDLAAAGPRYDAAAKSGAAYLRLSQALVSYYIRSGQAEKANAVIREFESDNLDTISGRGARPQFDAALSAQPIVRRPTEGMAEALFDLASLLNQQNLGDLALLMSRLALHLQPDLDIAQLLVADILEDGKRDEAAIEAYGRIRADSPLAWPAKLRAAALLDRAGRTDEAVATLRELGRQRPNSFEALVTLGDILRGRERFPEAVAAYDEAVKRIGTLERRHWPVLYSRGIALERSKQWARAEADFLKALEFSPDQPYVLNYLGYTWVEQGIHLERALAMIETAVKLRPEDGYIVDSMGWVLFRLGRYEEAVAHLERAVELRPQDPVINDHLGDAYWRVGRRTEARFQWRRALTLKPEAEEISKIQGKLQRGLLADDVVRPVQREAIVAPAGSGG